MNVEEEEDDDVEEEDRSQDRSTPCASLRNRNAHGHVTRGILCGNLQGKCRTLIPRPAFCASLRSRNAYGMSQEAFCAEICRGNAGR